MVDSVLISLDGRQDLADAIIDSINTQTKMANSVTLDFVNSQKFSDGELCVDFKNSIRGKRVYLLSSPNTSDEIMKLNLAIDAAKRAAAKEIIPILPYFPYARQDKKDQSRGPIGAKVLVEMLEQRGSTGVVTFDLHADQIQGFFNIPVTHLEGKNVFDSYIAKIYDEDTILCGPDAGSGKRVKRMKNQLQTYHNISINYVMLDKTRSQANVIDEMVIIGDVKGKNVIILDDMVDTAGTLCKAAEVIMEAGAKSVRAIISHGVLSGQAFERIGDSVLSELVISDSLPKPDAMKLCLKEYSEVKSLKTMTGCEKIKQISLAKQIGFAIIAINSHSSYEGLKKERF
jgi:ribose-phosphate pyrophosphokinase